MQRDSIATGACVMMLNTGANCWDHAGQYLFHKLGWMDAILGRSINSVNELLSFAAAVTISLWTRHPCPLDFNGPAVKRGPEPFELAFVNRPQIGFLTQVLSDLALAGTDGLEGCTSSKMGNSFGKDRHDGVWFLDLEPRRRL